MHNDLHYEYEINPFSTFRNISVHPLSNSGFNQYLSKDSRVHKFISLTKQPKMTDNIMNSTTYDSNVLLAVSSLTHDNLHSSIEVLNTNSIVNTEPNLTNESTDKKESLNKDVHPKCRFLKNEAISRNLRRDKKFIVTNIEEMSHTIFQKLNKNYIGNSIYKKSFKLSNGFKPDKVPRTKDDLSWIKKEKFEVSRIKGLEKTLFQSVCFTNNKPLIDGKEHFKELYIKYSTKGEGWNLPAIPAKEKHQIIEVNKVNFNKFFGDKYNPYNYEVHKEKINTCSLKDSFKNKK